MPDALRPPGKIGLEGQQNRARLHELRRPLQGFNTWSLDEEASQPFFRQAVELGIDFWGTATVYQFGSSEEFVGRAVKRYTRRENVVLATKVYGKMYDCPGGQGLSRRAIMEQIDGSLTRLGTDFVDVYLLHGFDAETPVAETMEALHDVVKAGKTRYIGASSMFAWQFAKLQHAAELHGWATLVEIQDQYNLLKRADFWRFVSGRGYLGASTLGQRKWPSSG